MTQASLRDERYMGQALALARRGLGNTWPNPAVGCVLVREGRVVGRGWTQPGGRPHAEAQALLQAGERARGASAYVTLEPCSHYGKTPPCASALIEAGIKRVIVAITDPDCRVAGRGIALLQEAGIPVTLGICAEEAERLNSGYLLRQREGRPWVTLKIATSLDGKIAMPSGESQWITGALARRFVHRLRAEHDAVAVGIGTALADNPLLNCRLPGLSEHRKGRIVFDGRFRLPRDSALVSECSAKAPVWVIGCKDYADEAYALAEKGVHVLPVSRDAKGRPLLAEALNRLGESGMTRIFLEGGGTMAAAFFDAGFVDSLIWFHGAKIIGGSGLSSVGPLNARNLNEVPSFRLTHRMQLDDDCVSFFESVKNK